MVELDIELELKKARWLYQSGQEVAAFQKLTALTAKGHASAQHLMGLICQENRLLFMAEDIWIDLLNHRVSPRKQVAEFLYQILTWRGDFLGASELVKDEGLINLKRDLADRNFISDKSKLLKMAGSFQLAAIKAQKKLESQWTFEASLAQIEAKANLATLSSQLYYSGESFTPENIGMLSGDNLWTVDMKSELDNPEEIWSQVRRLASILIGDIAENGDHSKENMSKVATIGLEAQERLFFFNGRLGVEDAEAKQHLTNIAYGLQWTNRIASAFYSTFSESS